MRADELVSGLGFIHRAGPCDAVVRGLTDDSRKVRNGWAFVARCDEYVDDAMAKGASVVFSSSAEPLTVPKHVCWFTRERVDQAAAGLLAERFFGDPSKRLALIGITGTNGKTTTALLIQYLLDAAGIQTGVIGTVYVDDGSPGGRRPTELTTPGAIEFSYHLSRMADAGCKAVVAEISSHALDQGRAGALRFHTAVFTNLSQDHLDYHQSMDAYAKAKSALFQQITDDGHAVVNADDPHAKQVLGGFSGSVFWTTLTGSTGENDGTVCQAEILDLGPDTSSARFVGPWGREEAHLPLIGKHNVCNTLQAITASHTIIDMSKGLRETLEAIPQVPGRLERIVPTHRDETCPHGGQTGAAEPPTVLVDYAHTPDALENALSALRPVTSGRLIVMFGCGGDRDRTKRPKMAQAACRWADRVFLTSDNPRTEDPRSIIQDAMAGIPASKKGALTVIPDRAEAIRASVFDGGPDDTVLLAGKGHEDYQTIGEDNIHFDDREHAASALEEWPRQRAASCR